MKSCQPFGHEILPTFMSQTLSDLSQQPSEWVINAESIKNLPNQGDVLKGVLTAPVAFVTSSPRVFVCSPNAFICACINSV